MAAGKGKHSTLLFVLLLVVGTVMTVQKPKTAAGRWLGTATLFIGCYGLISTHLGKKSAKGAAQKMLELQKAMYAEPHEFATVDASALAGLDQAFYDQTQAWFESRQFRHLADIEDVTMKRLIPWMRTVLRVMLSHDGAITGSMYHVRVGGWQRLLQLIGVLARRMKMVDLETELSDGTFMETSNGLGVNRSAETVGVRRLLLSPETPLDELLRQHNAAVVSVLSANPSLTAVRISSLGEMIVSQHRLQAVKNAHKCNVGYLNRQDLELAQGRPLKKSEQAVLDEIESLKAQDGDP